MAEFHQIEGFIADRRVLGTMQHPSPFGFLSAGQRQHRATAAHWSFARLFQSHWHLQIALPSQSSSTGSSYRAQQHLELDCVSKASSLPTTRIPSPPWRFSVHILACLLVTWKGNASARCLPIVTVPRFPPHSEKVDRGRTS